MLNRAYGVEASISAQDLAHRLPTVAAAPSGAGVVASKTMPSVTSAVTAAPPLPEPGKKPADSPFCA